MDCVAYSARKGPTNSISMYYVILFLNLNTNVDKIYVFVWFDYQRMTSVTCFL